MDTNGIRPDGIAPPKWAEYWLIHNTRRIWICDNLAIESNVIDAAWRHGVKKLQLLGSSCIHLKFAPQPMKEMQHHDELEIVNVGTGEDVIIAELSGIVALAAGFEGKVVFDSSKPDGALRKLLDVSWLHRLGWSHSIPLEEGIRSTYRWFLEHADSARMAVA